MLMDKIWVQKSNISPTSNHYWIQELNIELVKMFKKELSTFGRFIGMLLLYSYSGLALAEDTFQTSSVVGDMVADAGKNA